MILTAPSTQSDNRPPDPIHQHVQCTRRCRRRRTFSMPSWARRSFSERLPSRCSSSNRSRWADILEKARRHGTLSTVHYSIGTAWEAEWASRLEGVDISAMKECLWPCVPKDLRDARRDAPKGHEVQLDATVQPLAKPAIEATCISQGRKCN